MKAKKRQRWLCSDPSNSYTIIVEVLKTRLYTDRVDLKVVQILKGNIATVGQILKDELFSKQYDKYLEGQDAPR